MLLEFLKSNLTPELYTQVSESLKGKELNAVPMDRFNEVNNAKKELETKLKGFEDYESIKTKNTELEEKLKSYGDYDELKTKVTNLTNEGYKSKLKEMGVDPDFVDFALAKIDVEKFEESSKAFLEANPKFKTENFRQIDSQLPPGGTPKKLEDMTTDEYLEFRAKNDLK